MKFRYLIICNLLAIIFVLNSNNIYSFAPNDSLRKVKIQNAEIKFKELLKIANENYVDEFDIEVLTEKTFQYMLNNLDPQSLYWTSSDYKKIKEINKGSIVGTGINIVSIKDTIYIYSVNANSPAYLSGIKSGSKILFINSIPVSGKSEIDVNNLLNGELNSTLSLIIKNSDESIKEFKITRSDFSINSVATVFSNNENIAYIKLARFSSKSDVEFEEALNKTLTKKTKGLIIDLRGNQGGYLDQTANMLSLFLKKNDTLIKSKAINQNYNINKVVAKDGKYLGLKIIVLIDNLSASGSEILSGALQDKDRAIIIGQQSYGKGTVQNTWEFNDGSAFRLTVAKYLTPSGRQIQKETINNNTELDPTLRLTLGENVYNTLAEQVKNNKIISKPEYFVTENGRRLISFGGINPDFLTVKDTLTLLTQVLQNNRTFYEFLLASNSFDFSKISKEYTDKSKFLKEFQITDPMLLAIKDISYKKNVWNDQMYEQDKEKMRYILKSILAEMLFGMDAYYENYIQMEQIYYIAQEKLLKFDEFFGKTK